jgi:hypothetical protein
MNEITGNDCCPPRQRSRRQAGVLAAAAAGVAVLAAACGGGGSSPAGSSPSHPAGYQQYHAYAACIRSHGAPFWPEPSQIPNGVFDSPYAYHITPPILAQEHGPGWQAALTACQRLAPKGLPFTRGADQRAALGVPEAGGVHAHTRHHPLPQPGRWPHGRRLP